jgi:NAD(P)H-hydrate epimerase
MEGVLSRAEMRALDRRASEEYGMPSIVLMENAGRACAEEALRVLAGTRAGPVLVLCGPGNNGGDGLVIARTLHNRGVEVRALFVGPRAKLAQAAADVGTNLRLWTGLGQTLATVEDARGADALEQSCDRAELVVDALFGTGLDRPLCEPWTSAIRAVNASRRPVLAVDLPSGLDADTGAELGAAVRAAVTVTLVARKPGLALGRGPERAGRVVVAEIGIPRAWLAPAPPG